jgi:hypothetical protein
VTVEENVNVIARITKSDGVEIHVCRAGAGEIELRDYEVREGVYGASYRLPMAALAALAQSWQVVPSPRGR